MRDILYEMKKQEQIDEEIDPKTILPKEFHEYLNVFLKATVDTVTIMQSGSCRVEVLDSV